MLTAKDTKNILVSGLTEMKVVKEAAIHLTPDDEKTHFRIPFILDKDTKKIVITYSYFPKKLTDEEKSYELIKENLLRDAGEDAGGYEDYSEFMPLKNLVTLSLDSPEGYRGAAHRQANEQRHIIGKDFASVGFIKGEPPEGEWTLVLNAHAVVTDSVECKIKIEAEEGTE